ncbi:MAG: hypothetical protein JXR58_02640 [Bacteroidales bacterium]|nr:hypothetical protein [Bacteroidales bacterium]
MMNAKRQTTNDKRQTTNNKQQTTNAAGNKPKPSYLHAYNSFKKKSYISPKMFMPI